MIEYMLLIVLGLFVGFFAGLLGIGGGAIMVPVLTSYFLWQGIDAALVVHLALATSMSCIVINAVISVYTHQKHQAIVWSVTTRISPTIVLGSTLATFWVVQIESKTIALIFTLLMILVAIQMVIDFKSKASQPKPLTTAVLAPAGFIIGWLSAMIAIGGGSLTVPFLHWYRVDIKKAIATAASIGLPLALAGTMVFLMQGIGNEKLPKETIGYVFWPATLLISLGSVFTTPLGAKLTHKLPIPTLKKIFALLIVILALRMFFSL